ncbi:insulinase family protein [Sphingomonas suaedae]|uniref:Insulinase family protein n=1 Tax=Sphingomonas suaedae TaxID=2599297 RepID=A0A518RF18_9SPHN|nr:pitrilysin family protein [Sphingomonas suaedae]QDX26062.1 insulinase family protein [Sphingomonas suaedae]
MRLTRTALFLGAALLPFSVQAQQAAPVPAAQKQEQIAVAPLDFTERTLPNGLKVYAIRDTSTANVSVQVWYDVGSKDDPAGKSGFAHMFEHLMFKGTRNLVDEQMDRLTEDVGGYNNASTNADYTNYYEVVPANHLERLLFAEADRMASLVVDEKVFASERDVVKEELRSRVLAQPYGKLFYVYFPNISYSVHPYARPGIGSIEDLDAANIDDIRAFHATYYRPDNAVLVVAGNFDPAQLDKWVDKYFAPIAKPNRPIPRVTVSEPARTTAVRQTVYEPNTPLPAVLLSYQLPPDNHPDLPALTVLDGILSGGENSRLYRNLVYRDQLVAQADTFLDSRQSTGAYAMYAILAGGKSAQDGEAAMRREIAALRDTPVSDAELAEAKNEILTSALRSRETAEGKASTLAASIIIDRDPRHSDRQLAEIARVTAADVQRVARNYLGDNQSAAIIYLPDAMAQGAKGDSVGVASTVKVAPLVAPKDIVIHTAASEAERIAVPAPAAPVSPIIPVANETRLANGIRVIVVEKRDLPIVTATVVAPAGGASDPQGKAGTAALTAELLTKGTATRSAEQIAQQIESLGGSIGAGADWDAAFATVTVKADQVEPALTVLADVARNPAFAQEELERARKQTLDGVTVQLKDPAALAGIVANRAVFGAAPYGHMLSGNPTSLPKISRSDIADAYGDAWQPDKAALVIVGDIAQKDAVEQAKKLFGDWKADTRIRAATAAATPSPRVIVVDLPEAGQAGVVVARPGIARDDKDFYAAQVANATLGVGFTSRLNREIRIKRGLAYGAGSSVDARRAPGIVTASTQTKNPSAPEVVALIAAEMKALGAAPVPETELDSRKAVLVGSFGRRIERTDGIAGALADYVADGVPLDTLQTYIPAIQGVDPAAVQAAAKKVLDPSSASIVVVGDSKQFVDALRKTYPQLEVIPASALNLDSATLK